VDKNGNYAVNASGQETDPEAANYISGVGMGWFPGYAISVESGERLNIMYGESSWLVGENGRDMMFNPTANVTTPIGDILMGGKHFVYILRHSPSANSCPAYDKGKWIYNTLEGTPTALTLMKVHSEIMWTGIPMAVAGEEWLQNDALVRLRVNYPYQTGTWSSNNTPVSSSKFNDDYPAYGFNTGNIATIKNDITTAENALDLIRAVPNPYYAFSSYETDQLDNRVRITNLPELCTISIYSSNGTLVRRYSKDETNTYLDWDLKNTAAIPIASGIYYIHIDAPNIGEKIIKWFGVLRPVDLNAF